MQWIAYQLLGKGHSLDIHTESRCRICLQKSKRYSHKIKKRPHHIKAGSAIGEKKKWIKVPIPHWGSKEHLVTESYWFVGRTMLNRTRRLWWTKQHSSCSAYDFTYERADISWESIIGVAWLVGQVCLCFSLNYIQYVYGFQNKNNNNTACRNTCIKEWQIYACYFHIFIRRDYGI